MSVDEHARLAELAAALKQRFRASNDPRDLDRCIDVYANLLDGPGAPGSVTAYVSYANALLNRYAIRGDPPDVAAALSAAHHAVDLAGDDAGARAVALNVTANARTAVYQSGGDRTDLLAALEAQREAMALLGRGARRPPAAFLVNLASRLIYAYDLLRETALLDEAVACSEQALEGPLSDGERPAALNNLGLALRARFERTGDHEDLRRSLEAQRESLDRTSPQSVERPSRLNNLANAWWATYLAGGVLQDLDHAVATYEEAADAATSPIVRSACLLGLGTARWNRWGRRKTPADLDAAIGAFDTARGLVPPDSPSAAHCALNLGAAYFARWRHKHTSSDLDDAIAHWEFARQSPTAEGEVTEAATSNLGAALWERHEERKNDADLDKAIALLSAAPTEARITLQPGRLFTLAGALRRRHELRGAASDLAAGAATYRRACTIGTETNPGVALQSGQQWGEWAVGRGALDEAEEAYAIATAAAQRMYRSQAAEADTEVWLGEAATLAARRSYVQCQLGDPLAAALTLEHGRAYLLSEALTRRERRAEQTRDVVTADADTITHAGTPAPVVYLAGVSGLRG